MKKIFLISIILSVFFVNILACVAATEVDVSYLVVNPNFIKSEFTNALDDLGLSYDIVCYYSAGPCDYEMSGYDYSRAKVLLLNDDYFPNYNSIPINNKKALIVNGRHMDDWGWAESVSIGSSSGYMHINLHSHEITNGFDSDLEVYDNVAPDIYYLDKRDVFNGVETLGANINDNQDVVIGLATAGSVLTKSGNPDTYINADTIFFGVTESEYWTNNSVGLFKSSLMWLYGSESYTIELLEGINLISFPIKLSSNNVADIFQGNPHILSVKKYYNGEIIETSTIYNNRGYFVETDSDTSIIIGGMLETSTQNVELESGMNLVGIVSDSNVDLDNLDSEIIEVAKRNADGTYNISTKYPGGWYNEFPLKPGKGYWFKTNSQFIWSYNP
jgi:hypothetical protein